MKRLFSLIILIVAMVGIISLTIFALTHKEVKSPIKERNNTKIENVTSNLSDNNLSEIYNIYFKNERHKLKIQYLVNLEETATINLTIYFDGASIFENTIINNIEAKDVEEALNDPEFLNIKLDLKNIILIEKDNYDYFILDINMSKDSLKEFYYIYNSNGEKLLKDGLLVRDTSKVYIYDNIEDNNIFYNTEYEQLSTILDNDIYSLQENKEKDKITLTEYKYIFKKNKLKKEKLTTYDNIEVKNSEKE